MAANYDRVEWIARRVEQPIDSVRPIIDPHHHLWARADSQYLAHDLAADTTAGHNVVQTVFVECSASYDQTASPHLAPVGETHFVAEQAQRTGDGACIGAIVSHADLSMGRFVEEIVRAHELAGKGLFRGVRHGTNWSPHDSIKNGHHGPRPTLMAEPDFRDGVATLGDLGFTFDAWLYFDQLVELAALARAVPQTTIVLDHLGGPLGIGPHAGAGRLEMLEVWAAGIVDVASCPNVVLKVGGLGMEHYFGTQWADLPTPPSSEIVAIWWAEVVHAAIDAFGPDRCMFESNFPVDRQTLPYTVLWNAFQILADRYDRAEQQSLFGGTAERTYRLASLDSFSGA